MRLRCTVPARARLEPHIHVFDEICGSRHGTRRHPGSAGLTVCSTVGAVYERALYDNYSSTSSLPTNRAAIDRAYSLSGLHSLSSFGEWFPCGNCASYFAMKILIAEDDRDSRELLSWLLQKLDYQVLAT